MYFKEICNIIYPFTKGNKLPKNFKNIVKEIGQIKIHNLLNLPKNLRSQFKFLVYPEPYKLPFKFISIHIFKKEFKKNREEETYICRYCRSIYISNKQCPIEYDWKYIEEEVDDNLYVNNLDENDINYINNIRPTFSEEEITINIDLMYDNYLVYNDLFIPNFDDYYDLNDDIILHNFSFIYTGFYFNIDDIRWQGCIKDIMCSEIGDHGTIVESIKSNEFIKTNIKEAYFINYNSKSIYEKNILNSFTIACDKCFKQTADDENIEFWHNDYAGDLCYNCYIQKIENEKNRIIYLKKLILIQGKKKLFNDDLIKTKGFLKNYKFKKLSITKKYNIMKNINKELHKENIIDKACCPICFDVMNKNNLSFGSCGHCFHTTCIERLKDTGNFNCPICRKESKFTKAFL